MDEIVLRLDVKTLDYIANVLAQRPFAEVARVLEDITKQVKNQQQERLPDPNGQATLFQPKEIQ